MQRLSVDSSCKGKYTCPAVWLDDVPGHLIIVGHPVDRALSDEGEASVRLKQAIITAAGIAIVDSACDPDHDPTYVIVRGELVPAAAVAFSDGSCGVAADEIAVRVRSQVPCSNVAR
jgi:hypothetical protein